MLALVASSTHANWSMTLQAPAGNQTCPAIVEPFVYQTTTCEFFAQRASALRKASTRSLWEDQLVASAVSFGNACSVPYAHYLWIDGAIYPLPAGTIIQHQRNALTAFALSLSNCVRPGNVQPVSVGTPRLLLSNRELVTSGSAFWHFDQGAMRAYLRVTTVTGDVRCDGAQATPLLGDVVFRNGVE